VPTHEATEFARQMTDRPAAQASSGGEEEARQLPAHPVCVEVPVRIHGSEVTSPVPGVTVHSELFHEETRTLIVFPRGAVVRLSARVTQGQVLVLTNLRTNQEMPCRVVSVRNSANVEDYVELEFARGAPGFWGVNFPSETSSSAAPARPAASLEPKFEAPAVAVPPPPSSFKKVSDSRRPVADTYSSKGAPSVKFPAEGPIRESTPVGPAAIVGTKKEDPPAGHAPAVEVTPRAIVVEPPPAGPAPSQEVFSLSQRTKAPTEVSTPAKASAPAELKIEEPPATGSSDQETAGVSSEAEVAALVSETISLLATVEAKAKQSPVRSIPPAGAAPPTGKERESVARPSTADRLPVSLERTAWGAKTAHEDTSAVQTLAAWLAGHLAARKAAAERSPVGKLTLVLASVSVFAMVLGGGWLLFRHHWASGTATSVTQDAIPVQTPEPTGVASQSAPANEWPATQPQASVAAERQPSIMAPPPAAPKEQPKRSANDLRISPAVSKLSSRLVPPKSVAVPREAPPVPSIGSEVLDVVPDGQSNSVVGAVVPGVSRPGLALALPPLAPGHVPPRVGGQVKEPRLVSVVKPVYPAIARQSMVEGDVVVETEIDVTGKVTRMKVLSGPALLHQAAMNALRNWRYEPAMLDGQALAVQIRVTVKFHLR
jgi:periplasmic protein TonB